MNTHASDHDDPVDHGDAFTCLCCGDGSLLACWATADPNKVIFGRTHFDSLKPTNAHSGVGFVRCQILRLVSRLPLPRPLMAGVVNKDHHVRGAGTYTLSAVTSSAFGTSVSNLTCRRVGFLSALARNVSLY
jgi:hypothetical protein